MITKNIYGINEFVIINFLNLDNKAFLKNYLNELENYLKNIEKPIKLVCNLLNNNSYNAINRLMIQEFIIKYKSKIEKIWFVTDSITIELGIKLMQMFFEKTDEKINLEIINSFEKLPKY